MLTQMHKTPRRLCLSVLGSLLALCVTASLAIAQQAAKRSKYEQNLQAQLNAPTIGLAAGRLEGAPIRFASELARIVDDGRKMRVLPIVTHGPFENMHDLLYLRGIDAAIIYGDVLDHFKKDGRIANIGQRINFITHLIPSELHVFVRPEIGSLTELTGKPVNFNTHGTAAAYSGPIIFDRLGIKVQAHFTPHPVAMAEMAASDKFAAVVFVSSKPLDPFVKRKWPAGFKFLPIPLTEKLEEYYLPASLEHADYPDLIGKDTSIKTVAVPGVLAVYAWPEGSERHKRLSRLVDYMFEHLPSLQIEAGYHRSWKDLNLAANVPGWQRFRPMQERLAAAAASKLDSAADGGAALKQAIAQIAPGDPVAQSRLFRKTHLRDNGDRKGQPRPIR